MKIVKLNFYYFRTGSEQTCNIFKNVDLNKNYYTLLQVQHDACENVIKKSYLKLVKKLHPDMNPSGHQQFTEVQEAYNVLSDKKLKKYYDQNNPFYKSYKQSPQPNTQYEDPRNQQFYSKMKGQQYNDFRQKQEEAKRQEEDDEQAKQRKKFEDQIKLTRKNLFTRNPIWERANAYMNYEQRQRRVQEKQKQLEELFPQSSKIASSFKKWIF